MPIYKKVPKTIDTQIAGLMKKYHGPLVEAKVTIDALFAEANAAGAGTIAPDAHPVRHHGRPVMASIKVNSYKLRFQGHADAEITIDEDAWDKLSDAEQDALLDHELQHLELKTDKDGGVMRDDLDRPRILMRKHDHEFGWFDACARRHGTASLEVKELEAFLVKRKQLWIPFEKENAA